MKTVRCRLLSPVQGIFHGWETWVDVDYEVNPVGSDKLYSVDEVRYAYPPKGSFPEDCPATQEWVKLNHHRLDNEIAKRVMKAAGQKPDDVPASPTGKVRKRPLVNQGTREMFEEEIPS